MHDRLGTKGLSGHPGVQRFHNYSGARSGSVLAQTVQDFEVLVVNDGSTDGTGEMVQSIADPRVRLLTQQNGGASAARNKGIQSATGEWVAFLDADDVWLPQKLETQLRCMHAKQGCLASQGGAYFVDKNLVPQTLRRCVPVEQPLLTFLRFQNLPNAASSWVVKRDLFEEIGGFDTGLVMHEDWDLSLRLARHANPLCIDVPLTLYRVHPGNRSLDVDSHIQSGLRILDRLFADASLPPDVRAHEREIYARYYTMLCGAMLRVGRRRPAAYWGLRAVRMHPLVLGYILALPLRRFRRRRPCWSARQSDRLSVGAARPTWQALVAFTTSNRGPYVKRCLPQLAHACRSDPRLSILVALDGDDPETRALCEDWEVPLVYSEAREGVGLSKNRVLESFPDYDFYFFVEDDVEVIDGSVFARHVALMQAAGIHHMSLFTDARSYAPVAETSVQGQRIRHYEYGGAQLNAFTRMGLARVGGWHPLFATYRRWGHVEHSYRFPRNKLAPAPFNVAVELIDSCICHVPPAVTNWVEIASLGADGLSEPERELMNQELAYVPLQTLAPYHLDGPPPGQLTKLSSAFGRRRRYPLLSGAARRRAYADYFVWRSETADRRSAMLGLALLATVTDPTSIALRHAVKVRLLALRVNALRIVRGALHI